MPGPTKKDTPHPKTKKKQYGSRGIITIKSDPIPVRKVTHKLENNNTREVLHCCEGSGPHLRLPSLGIWQRDWESLGNLALKVSGIYLQDFHRTGGDRDSRLGRHEQNLAHTKTQRKGAVTQQKAEPKLPASVGGSPVEAWVGRGSPQGPGHWQHQAGKVHFDLNPLGVCH